MSKRIGFVYEIRNSVNSKFYVGSTETSLNSRLSRHKSVAEKEPSKFHKELMAVGYDKWSIVPITKLESYNDAKELLLLENARILQYGLGHLDILNTRLALGKGKNQYAKEHYEKNKAKISEQNKAKYKNMDPEKKKTLIKKISEQAQERKKNKAKKGIDSEDELKIVEKVD